ncbi:hypothetical protein TNCV_4592701 [Trichonephila clavipes]|nr:hypothetical protein TNCV_4592701 [Trichonephila clavipes]
MGFGSRQRMRVLLFNDLRRAARLALVRGYRDWSVEDTKRVAWSDEFQFRLLNADGRLRIRSQDVLEQDTNGHHIEPTSVNIWQVIPVERFQKLVESMLRRVAAVIKARGDPLVTR